MTDEQILKALECCSDLECASCTECPLFMVGKECPIVLHSNALALIKRLTGKVHRLERYDQERDERLHTRLTTTARAEAIREFAERIKEQSYESIDWSHGVHPLVCEFGIVEEIAEEMTEEQK